MSIPSFIFLIFYILLALFVLAIWVAMLATLAGIVLGARQALQHAARGIPTQSRHGRARPSHPVPGMSD